MDKFNPHQLIRKEVHSKFLPVQINGKRSYIQATAEDLARNRGQVLSLYCQILRSINSPKLPLAFEARLAKKAEVCATSCWLLKRHPYIILMTCWVLSFPSKKRWNSQIHTMSKSSLSLFVQWLKLSLSLQDTNGTISFWWTSLMWHLV